jgi:hypothetical protein
VTGTPAGRFFTRLFIFAILTFGTAAFAACASAGTVLEYNDPAHV